MLHISALRILNINIVSEKCKNIANEKYTLKMLEIHYVIIMYTLTITFFFHLFIIFNSSIQTRNINFLRNLYYIQIIHMLLDVAFDNFKYVIQILKTPREKYAYILSIISFYLLYYIASMYTG